MNVPSRVLPYCVQYFRSSIISSGTTRLYSLSSVLFKQKKTVMNPSNNNLYIRYLDGSDTFQALFYCYYKPLNIEREFNFNRKICEPVDDFIKRIKANLVNIFSSKCMKLSKKKSNVDIQVELPEIEIKVIVGDECFPTSRTCRELFFDNGVNKIYFSILGSKHNVIINSPWVDNISLPSNIMVNFPVYPNKYEAVFANISDSQFKWFISKDGKNDWKEVGSGFIFEPSKETESSYLKLICFPSNGQVTGPEKECISSKPVNSGPGPCPFQTRHDVTQNQLDSSGLRVVSYNILADVYAETELAKTELFPYCPTHATSLEYRRPLYLKEILGYNADLICLQEVDEKVFHYDLTYVLGRQGLQGVFSDKGGTTREGVATFFASKKFRLAKSYRIFLGEEVLTNPVFKSLWDVLSPNTAAASSITERSTVLQVLVLERIADKKDKLVVANTHLYYHPDADHIRLAQTGLCMEFIKHLITDLKDKNPTDRYSLIFCGDFNSVPDCGAYLLMTSKCVPSDFKDWKSNKDEPIEGAELRQPFSLKSAYGTPQFTNYTQGFTDCLDYIYYQTDYLELTQIVPLPSEDVLRCHTALPSVVFPSDHVSLVADFTWK